MSATVTGKKTLSPAIARAAILALLLSLSTAALSGPIHGAARKGDQAKVIALLKQNPALVSSRDSLGYTPLHLAAQYDHPAIVELLLANGADVNAKTGPKPPSDRSPRRGGETPLTLALLSYYHKKVMELLVTHGADTNVTLDNGVTPLWRAIERNLPYDVQLLLANGANPDRPVWNGETSVHLAVAEDRPAILKMLLDYGANPNAKDNTGHTPMFYANATAPYSQYDDSKVTGFDNRIVSLLRAHGGHR